jgi:hypothetical protein
VNFVVGGIVAIQMCLLVGRTAQTIRGLLPGASLASPTPSATICRASQCVRLPATIEEWFGRLNVSRESLQASWAPTGSPPPGRSSHSGLWPSGAMASR